MLSPSEEPGICVIGRTTFDTGIGAFSHAACELFSRHLPTCIIPTDREPNDDSPVLLPNGRAISVCHDSTDQQFFFYADILFNGASDVNLSRLPAHGVHIAHFCFDSDELPTEWVYALNNRFDAAYVPTMSQQALAIQSGVRIPVGVLPIALPIESLLARPLRPIGSKVRVGTITAFHERKELERLVRAFIDEFKGRDDVELVIHSNLAFGDSFDRLSKVIEGLELPIVTLSNASLSVGERDNLLDSFDVFVNCSRGEGYSIGAREALALGKVLVLSDLGAHRDLVDAPGVFAVPIEHLMPARYPEIDNRIFGRQQRVSVAGLREGLKAAVSFVGTDKFVPTARARRQRAADFSFTKLSIEYASLIDPEAERTRAGAAAHRSDSVWHPAEVAELARDKLGANGSKLQPHNMVVVPAHDGGFFSVFNVFISHLVWSLQDDRCHMVLPDWDQARLVDRVGSSERTSFCYGKWSDGNIWTDLFEPLFGCSVEEMNDVEFLHKRSRPPRVHFNADCEPLLTYYHAHDLYRSPDFARFRRQYHEAYRCHIRMLPDLTESVDELLDAKVGSRRLLAAHVKHPSHITEQPAELMASHTAYFEEIHQYLASQAIDPLSDSWRIFLGTDQSATVSAFEDEFGDRVVTFSDARRTTAVEDKHYLATAGDDKGMVGFQVQHLVASSPDSWSTDMARDVLRDAASMARAEALFHIVSNVATAVSYMNPDLAMRYVEPRS